MTDPSPEARFPAFRLVESGEGGRRVELTLADLSPGEVLIRVAYSSVNYKDALAGTGRGKIARALPINGGIDAAGTVVRSESPAVAPGDPVVVTGCGLSETRDGGYAAYLRAPAEAVVPLPAGLSPYEAMVLGTAGFTAALALARLEENGLTPGTGPVAVTGASGGVGAIAVDLLAARGYEAVAVTRKPDCADWLRGLGASRAVDPGGIAGKGKPLETARWAGAIDNVGDGLLASLLAATSPCGSVASIGLAAGHELATTVMPFVLRGVSLIGVSASNCPRARREDVWARLGGPWKPPHLDGIAAGTIGLDGLPRTFERLLAGEARGRIVVELP